MKEETLCFDIDSVIYKNSMYVYLYIPCNTFIFV